mgnify:CR=1 FL=1
MITFDQWWPYSRLTLVICQQMAHPTPVIESNIPKLTRQMYVQVMFMCLTALA